MRLHVVVRGRVQGVGFRWFVREAARRRELAGWVKNLADGGVEVFAEGTEPEIVWLRGELGRGPDGAVVGSIEEIAIDAAPLAKPFSIIR